MGMDLVLYILEMPLNTRPDWEAARKHLMQQGDRRLRAISKRHPWREPEEQAEALEDAGADEHADVAQPKRLFLQALELVRSYWQAQRRDTTKFEGACSDLLMVGGSTVGDPFMEFYDMELVVESGMAKAAGFIFRDDSLE